MNLSGSGDSLLAVASRSPRRVESVGLGLVISLLLEQTAARAALAPAPGVLVEVFTGQWMSALAVCLVLALPLSPGILAATDDFQVTRVHAEGVRAQVVEGHALGDRTHQQLPCEPVSPLRGSPASSVAHRGPAVLVAIAPSARPQPALVGSVGIQREPVTERHGLDSHVAIYAISSGGSIP